jgi:hypothetical protein
MMLENNMNRLDMAQSMVLNAGQVSWTLVFCKRYTLSFINITALIDLQNSYILQRCKHATNLLPSIWNAECSTVA